MDPLWIIAAFVFGAVSGRMGLPPLVGYLIAGFMLNGFGVDGGELLGKIADIGVTLLLFTIGLKLKLKSLARPEVWAGTPIHMGITVAVFCSGILVLGMVGMPYFDRLGWQDALLVAFALSFSSTVFSVKLLEQKKETGSRHAAGAIGILIMQDIIAVVFLAFSAGQIPSPWAAVLAISLFVIKPIVGKFIQRCGHGELLILFGIIMTIAGYRSFELVGIKGDLGALVFGMLLASNPIAKELSDRMLGFKDVFLVGFFLNIGISGSPSLAGFAAALILGLAILFKPVLYFLVLTRFRLRARTSLLASLSLTNYSEFGLIVAAISVANGWISVDWLVILAIALSITFVVAAPLNSAAHRIYARMATFLKQFETAVRLPEDKPIDGGNAEIAIIGMGGLGTGAYDEINRRYGDVIMGVDFSMENVRQHRSSGRNVVYGDAEDSDFWERVEPARSRIHTVMLTLPTVDAAVFAIRQMRHRGYRGRIAASVRYEDEIPIIKKEGVYATYSLYEEAGAGFVEHVCSRLDEHQQQQTSDTLNDNPTDS
jgi:glutathione-regulated potassium-efflux system ancillary protein KefC